MNRDLFQDRNFNGDQKSNLRVGGLCCENYLLSMRSYFARTVLWYYGETLQHLRVAPDRHIFRSPRGIYARSILSVRAQLARLYLACAKSLGFLGITHPIATPPNLYVE
jgi:hypothetical protein